MVDEIATPDPFSVAASARCCMCEHFGDVCPDCHVTGMFGASFARLCLLAAAYNIKREWYSSPASRRAMRICRDMAKQLKEKIEERPTGGAENDSKD